MKAQVLNRYDDALTANQWVAMQDVPDPTIRKSTDVIVRIGGAGVCRTDLHIIEGVWRPHMDPEGGHLLPMIMGHENAGWVEEIGKEVEGIKVGDPVIVHPKISGGTCLACRRGWDMHGPGSFPGLDCNGGYAEYLATSERNIVALPKTLAPKEVAPYADAGLTNYRAVKNATRHLLPGESCVVIGAGGLDGDLPAGADPHRRPRQADLQDGRDQRVPRPRHDGGDLRGEYLDALRPHGPGGRQHRHPLREHGRGDAIHLTRPREGRERAGRARSDTPKISQRRQTCM